MSLINDALKKAQRDRDPLAPTDALGAGASGRGRPRTPVRHWLLLLGSGALVLIVLSVAFTLFWTTPDTPPRQAATPAVRPAAPASAPAPAPAIVPVLPAARPVPAETPPVAAPAPAPGPAPTATVAPAGSALPAARPRQEPPALAPANLTPAAPATAGPDRTEASAASEPIRTATTASPPAPVVAPAAPSPAAPPRPDEKVTAFIGTLRVAGVRALGDDSRVLINDRVYRVNDVIDRTLGVRLVRVEPARLDFVDGRGVTYVKHL
ncbi:MAG: hypothetical protein ACO3G4_08885 [Opitutaceae bacterium]